MILYGDDIFEQLSHICNCRPSKHINNTNRKRKQGPQELNWTKKCFFFFFFLSWSTGHNSR